jgi:hypothetical protein
MKYRPAKLRQLKMGSDPTKETAHKVKARLKNAGDSSWGQTPIKNGLDADFQF